MKIDQLILSVIILLTTFVVLTFASLQVPIKPDGVVDVDSLLQSMLQKKDGSYDTLFSDPSDSSSSFISKNNAYDISQAANKKTPYASYASSSSSSLSSEDDQYDEESQEYPVDLSNIDFNSPEFKAATANMDPELLKQFAGFDGSQQPNYNEDDGYGNDQKDQDYQLPADVDQLGSFDFEVFGKVQGVYFRDSSLKEAKTLEITGWIANTRAGSVVGHAEGYMPDLREFRMWLCKIGSRGSRIDKCNITQEKNQITRRRHAKFVVDREYENHNDINNDDDDEQHSSSKQKQDAKPKSNLKIKDEL